MAEAVGAIRVDLYANLAEWGTNLKRAEGQLSAFAARTKVIGDGFLKAGRGMSIALTAPLALFGTAAVKASADAQDLQGIFNTTFGDSADALTEWSKTTGDAMNRSTQTIQKTAVAFGEFFEDFAPSEASAVALSKTFTELTQDFAAFRNITSEQASETLIKGLAGSARGLKALGVDMSDTAMKAKALELGFDVVNGKLTEQQKVMVRASIIMQALQKVQGEIARSNGETAEETERAKERFQELLVTVGDKLLPVFNQFLSLASDLIDGFTSMDDGTQKLVITFAAMAAAAGPVALVIGGVTRGAGLLAVGLKALVGVGAAVVAFFVRMKAAQAAGAAVAAFGASAGMAAERTKQLGLSLKGAAGWFIALAPVAYEAGKAVASFFTSARENTMRDILKGVEAQFKSMGLSIDEARAARHKWAQEADAGKAGFDLADFQRIAASVKGTTTALQDNTTAATDTATATDAAAMAAADFDDMMRSLAADIPGVTAEVKDMSDEYRRVRDAVDPVGAALRQYEADLKIAAAAGVDATAAQRAFGQQVIDSLGGVAEARKLLDQLPPVVRQLVAEYDALAKKDVELDMSRSAFAQRWADAVKVRKDIADEAKRVQDEIKSFGDALTDQFDPAKKLADEIKRIDDAFKAGAISADVMARAKAAAFAASPEGEKQLELEKRRAANIDYLADGLTAVATGAITLGDAIKRMFAEALAAEVIRPFFTDMLSNLFPKGDAGGGVLSGLFSMIGSGIGSLFGGFGTMDKGGMAYAGTPYRIGAGVQEVFVPKTDGQVVRPPAGAMGAGAGGTLNFNFYGDDVGQYRASKRQIARQAQRSLRQ